MQLYCKEITKISFTCPSVSYPRNGVTWRARDVNFRFYPKKGPFFSRWEDDEKNFSIFRSKWFLEKKSEKKVKNGPFFEKLLFSSILGFNFHLELFFSSSFSRKKSLRPFSVLGEWRSRSVFVPNTTKLLKIGVFWYKILKFYAT